MDFPALRLTMDDHGHRVGSTVGKEKRVLKADSNMALRDAMRSQIIEIFLTALRAFFPNTSRNLTNTILGPILGENLRQVPWKNMYRKAHDNTFRIINWPRSCPSVQDFALKKFTYDALHDILSERDPSLTVSVERWTEGAL